MLIGYAWVSTLDQNLDLQRDALHKAGCEHIYTDTFSGSAAQRPGLEECLKDLRSGDTIVVWKLDWLGRSLKHLIEAVQVLEERGIGFKSLQGPRRSHFRTRKFLESGSQEEDYLLLHF
jgi:DNA invertase Pin-like site-specific DNA recombinase